MNIVPLNIAMVADVAARMRASDLAEIGALCWLGDEDPLILAGGAVERSQFGGVVLDAGGLPQAALGAAPIWPGVFSVWMIATDGWPDVWRSTVRFVRRVLEPCILGAGGHRAQCFAAAGHVEAHRLLHRLGFEPEGTAKGFGRDRQDFVMFGAVR